jgi:hypothetical protein
MPLTYKYRSSISSYQNDSYQTTLKAKSFPLNVWYLNNIDVNFKFFSLETENASSVTLTVAGSTNYDDEIKKNQMKGEVMIDRKLK